MNVMKKMLCTLLLMILLHHLHAATDTLWNHKKCAVVLTYDDGLDVHLTNVIPALDSLSLKATFYICNYAGKLNGQLPAWRSAAANGHELGNHTIYHPCTGSLPGRSFVKPDYDMDNYSVKRISDEVKTMNILLKAIDGESARTFAYPCGDSKIKDTPYINNTTNEIIAARAVWAKMPRLHDIDLYNIPCYSMTGQTGEQMIALVQQAMANNSLLVFLFHGVGGEHTLNVSLPAHRQLLQYLKQHEQDIWIAPMIDVAGYIKAHQAKPITQ